MASFDEGKIVVYLIEKYGARLNIDRDTFPGVINEMYGIHERTVRSWLVEKPKALQKRSVDAMVDYFSVVIPSIQPSWFRVKSIEAFRRHEEIAIEKGKSLVLELENGIVTQVKMTELIGELDNTLYSLYRYGFENTGAIVKELLNFYRKGDRLMCRWYFRIRGNYRKTLRMAEGIVIPIGDNYFIFTVTKNPDQQAIPRIRAMLLAQLSANPNVTKYRQGIMLSSVSTTKEPCAARTVLCRVDDVTNIKRYAEENVAFLTKEELKMEHPKTWRQYLEDIANDVTSNNNYILTIATSSFAMRWGRNGA